MFVDLHVHTYFSDGSLSPEEVVSIAKERNLSAISVCDHNTLEAYARLHDACKNTPIKLVQGVELDVYWEKYRLHLLGYNFNPGDIKLDRLIRNSRYELDQISVEMIRKMQDDYSNISLDEYAGYDYKRGLGGWKGINYLKDKGLIDNLEDGMRFHMEYGGYTPKFPTLAEACAAIKNAGGVPVIAHPGNWWLDIPDNFTEILAELKNNGAEGIECYYPPQVGRFRDICVDFCRKNDMRITCGGDCHGVFSRIYEGILYDIGVVKVDSGELDLRGIL